MINSALILIFEAMLVFLLVLGAHSLRTRYGRAPFFAMLGALTAIMSWVTDAGVGTEVAGVTFMVGSTVFYTGILLAVFVVYVFDGPAAARLAIGTVIVVSILMPLTAAVLHWQMGLLAQGSLAAVPTPSLRINSASVAATFVDLIFLAIAWELLGRMHMPRGLWLRTYLALFGVMLLDVVLFTSGAFAGTPEYLSIMSGTLVSRLIMSLFAFPFLYGYLRWQLSRPEHDDTRRPVLAILQRNIELEAELSRAQVEIARRIRAESERRQAMEELRQSRADYQEMSEKLRVASTTDDLTGIYNRRYFNEVLLREWRRAAREGTQLSLLLMDVDDFKSINDRHGHLGGDRVLKQLAQTLALQFRRPADIFARYGGDEFAAILPATHAAGACKLAQNCWRTLEGTPLSARAGQGGEQVRLCIGVATLRPTPDMTPEDLVERADQALYRAKSDPEAQVACAGDELEG